MSLSERNLLSLLVRSSNINISASLISFLLDAAGAGLYSFDNLFYGISESHGLNYFVQIVNPKYWLVTYLISSFSESEEVNLFEQIADRSYLELSCNLYGPLQDDLDNRKGLLEVAANSISCIECDGYQEFEVSLHPLNSLFRRGPSARILAWSDETLEESEIETEKLLAKVYLKLDFHLTASPSYTRNAELWVLPKKNENVLIERLTQVAEDDLRSITIAEVMLPNGDDAFVIRDLLSGGMVSRLIPLGVSSLYSSLVGIGLPNFFIPSDQQMSPALRSDYLGAMIDYRTHEYTLLGMVDENLIVSSIPISAFQSISQVIKYVAPSIKTKYSLKLHQPFSFRRNPNFLQRLIDETHQRTYKVIQLNTRAPSKISVPLRLEPQFRRKPPDLWIVPVENSPSLIQFLRNNDPRNFLIGCVGNNKGLPEFFIIKESLSGTSSLPNTRDQSYTADKELPNLYLPSDKFLLPIITPETLQSHLAILPNELTIISDAKGEIEVIKISKHAVIPIQRLDEIQIIVDFDLPKMDIEWKRPKRPSKKKELGKPPRAQPPEPVAFEPPTLKKRGLRKKRKSAQKEVSWDDVQVWVHKSGTNLPIDALIEQFELSPSEFLEKIKDHVSTMKQWEKKRGIN